MAYELKTKKNAGSVSEFLKSIDNDQRRKDAKAVMKLMRDITGARAAMWGGSIIGFGKYAYQYKSGQKGEWFQTGLSPRKQNLVVYIMSGFPRHKELMGKLGKYKTGKSCLYINKLEDVDLKVLTSLIRESVKHVKKTTK